jgi:hypothetical protein
MTRLSADSLAAQIRDFPTNHHEYCGLVGTLKKAKKRGLLVRCEEAMDEGVLCQLRCRVKIELRHDLGFMKLDSLR